MSTAHIAFTITLLLAAAQASDGEGVKDHPSSIITATAPGALALDCDSFGGNPFATALIKAIGEKPTKTSDLNNSLTTITKQQSLGRQSPGFLRNTNEPIVPFSAEFDSASKLALVLVYSDYSGSRLQSLPGAEFDLKRIRKTLSENGFDCWALFDPSESQVKATLTAFRTKSNDCDFSIIYVTGHGVEVDDVIYLLPTGYPIEDGKDSLKTRAIRVVDLQNHQQSQRGNFLFYGGCRNDPF